MNHMNKTTDIFCKLWSCLYSLIQ